MFRQRRPTTTRWSFAWAYSRLGDPENKLYALQVGRQELAFGQQRLLGGLAWTNTARSFDAVRATVRPAAIGSMRSPPPR